MQFTLKTAAVGIKARQMEDPGSDYRLRGVLQFLRSQLYDVGPTVLRFKLTRTTSKSFDRTLVTSTGNRTLYGDVLIYSPSRTAIIAPE